MGFELYLPKQYLDATLMATCLSVWVLIGLFTYLNRYTRRRYLSIWTAAWLFYALWLTLNFHSLGARDSSSLTMIKLCCVSACASLLIWGSAVFLEIRTRQTLISAFLVFLGVWSYLAAYELEGMVQSSLPIFLLLSLASFITAGAFLNQRRRSRFVGAGLLSFGFLMWGVQLGSFPFFLASDALICTGFLSAAVIQLFIAVSMIVLMLEEVRAASESVQQQLHEQRSEQAALNARIATTEERYRSLFQQASEGILICEADTLRLLELNPTAERLLGITQAEASQHTLATFCKPISGLELSERNREDWLGALAQKDQIHLVRRDGGEILVELNGSRIDLEGRPAYQFFFRELTERVQLEKQLRQAEKLSALGCMISGIAHELNNPLTVVRGYLELILGRHQLADATRADLEKVAHESNRAAKIVGNFLAFARQQTVRAKPVNFNALVRQVAEARKLDLQAAGVQLELDLLPDLPTTSADGGQVEQILANLITNAIQAMSSKAGPHRLRISTFRKADLLQIKIEDNGLGVPPHLRSRIFEPFFTTKEVGVGTGLGLSIVHSIMLDHKGQILYETSRYGGAAFVLQFPLVQPELEETSSNEVEPEPLPAAKADTSKRAYILIVDDERSIAEMLGEMLSLLGHKPTLCHSAPQAIELIENQKFDLILSDFRMPTMDGQEFYQRISEKHPALARRFAFLSGDVINDETQLFLKACGRAHLAKPFRLEHVARMVARILDQADAPQENVVPVSFSGPNRPSGSAEFRAS